MERLHFGKDSNYSALEASIHCVRYLVSKQFVHNKIVLDAACGEGYGSWLIKNWGAKHVTGLDISPEAITSALNNFPNDQIEYKVADLSSANLILDKKFDVIVSLETIEHVDDPEVFLNNLRSNLADNGQIIISCPNDNWYYEDADGNPYHKRKFTLQQFKKLSTKILGPASHWCLGTIATGFAILPEEHSNNTISNNEQSELTKLFSFDQAAFVPAESEVAVGSRDCSFFIGIWGAGQEITSSIYTGYPVSMNNAPSVVPTQRSEMNEDTIHLQAYISNLEKKLDAYTNSEYSENAFRDLTFKLKSMENQRDIAREIIQIREKRILQLESQHEPAKTVVKKLIKRLKLIAQTIWPTSLSH